MPHSLSTGLTCGKLISQPKLHVAFNGLVGSQKLLALQESKKPSRVLVLSASIEEKRRQRRTASVRNNYNLCVCRDHAAWRGVEY